VQTIRAISKQPAWIGFSPVGAPKAPKTNSTADIEAARTEMFRTDNDSLFNAAWWADPLFFGKYPEDGLKYHEANMPEIRQGDMELIGQAIDFYGVNIYTGDIVKADENGNPANVKYAHGYPRTHSGWTVSPEMLYWGPKFLYERYRKPIYVTENGLACMDWICEDGKVHDVMRIDFLRSYLNQLSRAYEDGVDVRGYFHWSLLDNFEWSKGFSERFGLVYVDYETLKRTPKDSFEWFQSIIREHKGGTFHD
jgi:beta-glucosidase